MTASNFLEHFYSCLSPFLTSYVAPHEIYFANLFEFVFHNSTWNSLHVIYLHILKSVKIFKQRTNWKNSFYLKYHAFRKYHTTFNLVGESKLQYQWKNISLLRGFSASVQQCSSSSSKNIWRNSFKSGAHLTK